MKTKNGMKKKFDTDLETAIGDLVEDITEKAEDVRERAHIIDDSDVFCLMDELRVLDNHISKAYTLKSVKAIKNLRKKIRL